MLIILLVIILTLIQTNTINYNDDDIITFVIISIVIIRIMLGDDALWADLGTERGPSNLPHPLPCLRYNYVLYFFLQL